MVWLSAISAVPPPAPKVVAKAANERTNEKR